MIDRLILICCTVLAFALSFRMIPRDQDLWKKLAAGAAITPVIYCMMRGIIESIRYL